MKKKAILCVCMICGLSAAVLTACARKADPIVLPDPGEVVSLDVTADGEVSTHSDRGWIGEILEALAQSEPTRKQSIQDTPQEEHLVKLDFHFAEGTGTLFAYEKDGNYFVEQPYQGIYRIEKSVYERIKEQE